MVVNFEFLGNEPIENVITCLNFRVDKVVFFGYREVIQRFKDSTDAFLKEYCGVGQVSFYPLAHDDLQSVLETMKKEIEHELSLGADIYFDITGGESLILVAFGMLSREYDTPMHLYDVPMNKLIELEEGAAKSISKEVVSQKVKMDLDRFIKMRGGSINNNLQKGMKDNFSEEFESDVEAIWEVARQYGELWNPFSDFIRKYMIPNGSLQVERRARKINSVLSGSSGRLKTPGELIRILEALAERGLLEELSLSEGRYSFRFKSQEIKNCLWESGIVLELHVYRQEKRKSDDCRIGVHIDWDGVIHGQAGIDVLNEVDVLSLSGFVPTFISCKSGKMRSQIALHALYELDTVAKRFGGKYARKLLVTTQWVGNVYRERAKEMGIEILKL